MLIAYYDMGTSNTRLYLLSNKNVIYKKKLNAGCRDKSIHGKEYSIEKNMKDMLDEALIKTGIERVEKIFISGMVSSPYGIVEIEHLKLPVSKENLFNGIYKYFEPIHFKRELLLIRGAKTHEAKEININCSLSDLNNVRGEEIEAIGAMSLIDPSDKPYIMIFPGSHTHSLFIKNGEIRDIFSAFSGELFCALEESTVLSNSINCGKSASLDKEMLLMGYQNAKNQSFNRAIYLAHTMKVFSLYDANQITSYIEGVINFGIVDDVLNIIKKKWLDAKQIFILGNGMLCQAFFILFQKYSESIEIKAIEQAEIEFACLGLMELLKLETIDY